MRVAIVEDIKTEQEFLNNCLKRYCTEQLTTCDTNIFSSGTAFVQTKDFNYDLIFLDIFMPGLSGLDTAAKIRAENKNVLLVFTTTSPDFAVKSYRVRAFDYLVKPYTYAQFSETMHLVSKELSTAARLLTLKIGRNQAKVLCRDILYVDYSNHYIQIHLANDEIVRSQMYFEEIIKLLEPFPQFLYCNRNCIVNMDKVAGFKKNDFVLNNGELITMNRNAHTELRQKYADYIFQKQNGGAFL
jgi:two-component system LytT family response regulator